LRDTLSAMAVSRGRDQVDEIVAAWQVELPEVASLPLELCKRVTRLAWLIDEVTQDELDALGLTRAEFDVLARLRSAGRPYRRKPNDLSKSLFLTSGGITHVLQRLAGAGMVTREADPGDGRSVWVQLTPSGVELAEKAMLATNAAQGALLDRVPESTCRALTELLHEVNSLAARTVPGRARLARPGPKRDTGRRARGRGSGASAARGSRLP
jgi:DNA-binding MarR family transcriptional regulator